MKLLLPMTANKHESITHNKIATFRDMPFLRMDVTIKKTCQSGFPYYVTKFH